MQRPAARGREKPRRRRVRTAGSIMRARKSARRTGAAQGSSQRKTEYRRRSPSKSWKNADKKRLEERKEDM